jgi:CRISPR-associated protein Cas1
MGSSARAGFCPLWGSRERVAVAFDPALVAPTRELIAAMWQIAQSGTIPPLLADSPTCPRSALVGTCLPDESGWLRQAPEVLQRQGPAVRRLVPERDGALPSTFSSHLTA